MAEEVGRPAATPPGPERRWRARREAIGIAVAVAALAVVVALVAWTGGGNDAGGIDDRATPPTSGPAGVRIFEVRSQAHVSGPVDYPETPPVGGAHDPTWQNCGFYSEPVVKERGVHSLEHGAVWVTYRPGLAGDQLDILRRLAGSQSHILVSPWAGELPSPVVASAWGRQLGVDSAADPRLAEFVRAFRTGPQTPEPGAPCTGGRSTPG